MYTTAVLIAHTFLWYVKIDLLYISPLLIKCISLNTHKLHLFHGKTFTKLSLSARTGRSLYKMINGLFVTFFFEWIFFNFWIWTSQYCFPSFQFLGSNKHSVYSYKFLPFFPYFFMFAEKLFICRKWISLKLLLHLCYQSF